MILNNKIHGVLYDLNTHEVIAECNNITIEKEKDEIKNQQLIHCYNIRGFNKTLPCKFV
jgi:hypothetical protein